MLLTKLSAHGRFHPLPFAGIPLRTELKQLFYPMLHDMYKKIFKTRDRYITKYVQRIFKNEI